MELPCCRENGTNLLLVYATRCTCDIYALRFVFLIVELFDFYQKLIAFYCHLTDMSHTEKEQGAISAVILVMINQTAGLTDLEIVEAVDNLRLDPPPSQDDILDAIEDLRNARFLNMRVVYSLSKEAVDQLAKDKNDSKDSNANKPTSTNSGNSESPKDPRSPNGAAGPNKDSNA